MISRRVDVHHLGAGTALTFRWQGTPSRAEEYAIRKALVTVATIVNGERPVAFVDYDPVALADRLIVRPASLGVPKHVGRRLPR